MKTMTQIIKYQLKMFLMLILSTFFVILEIILRKKSYIYWTNFKEPVELIIETVVLEGPAGVP